MIVTAQRTGMPCSGCGSRIRHPDDRYHLQLPDVWTLDDVRAWGTEGATVGWLERRGVKITKRCLICQTKAGKP